MGPGWHSHTPTAEILLENCHCEWSIERSRHAYQNDICHCEERFLRCHSDGQAIPGAAYEIATTRTRGSASGTLRPLNDNSLAGSFEEENSEQK